MGLNNFMRFLKDYNLLLLSYDPTSTGFITNPKTGSVLDYKKVSSERA
jgi:hypothetical protein